MSKRWIRMGLVLLWACAGTAMAQGNSMSDEYAKQIKSAEAVGALGNDLFGEQTSFYTGSTEFTATDVSLPGNNRLPVSVGRRFVVQPKPNVNSTYRPFRDWDFDIPHLQGVFRGAWNTRAGSRRCNVTAYEAVPPTTTYQGATWDGVELWNGTHLYVPGQGEQEMLLTLPENTHRPTDGKAYLWVTANQWYFSCLPIGTSDADAFLAVSPDGTRYWFDWLAARNYSHLTKNSTTPGGLTGTAATGGQIGPMAAEGPTLPRQEAWLLPTRVEDRFGNWVTYTYDTANPWQLKQILASDGRQLTVTYDANGYVAAVNDGTRSWDYGYTGNNLTTVTLPDDSQWKYALSALTTSSMETTEPGLCDGLYLPSNDTYTGTITHPSGAQGQFSFKGVIHGRSYVTRLCYEQMAGSGTYYARFAKEFATLALKQKTITGPGLTTAQWTYTYSAPNDSFVDECGACATTKTVEVAGPDNAWTRYTFGNRFQDNEGKLLTVETGSKVGANAPAILRTENTAYQLNPVGQAYPERIGQSPYTRSDRTAEKHKPALQRQIVQQGTTFTWQANSFDPFASPLSVTRSSTLGHTRTDVTAFHHNTAQWVIGQVASSTNSNTGVIESRTDYDATTALPTRIYGPGTSQVAGKLQQTLTYTTTPGPQAGTLATVKDGNNNITTFSNWMRGIPQLIKYPVTPESPSGATQSAGINNIGGIDSVTDENGHQTKYGYDDMGRLSLIDYPDGDNPNWLSTTRVFEPVNGSEYGLSAGHWRQTITTGNANKLTYFDALWRPIVTREYDAGNVAGTQRFTRSAYDAEGRVTFASYPGTSDALTMGVHTTYDALGRPQQVWQNSEPGMTVSTTYEYLAGFQTRVTNPRTYPTTTRYLAYDQPTTDWPVAITHPEGTYTDITRDLFGKPTAVKRRNADGTIALTRNYGYDAHQQLCLSLEPETQATVRDYDGAGQLAWSAGGRALAAATPCDTARTSVADADRIKRSYDARLRLKTLSFPGGNGNQVWTYTPDGLPSQITTANDEGTSSVVNAYGYNKRRLLTSESQTQLGMPTWSLGYGYDSNGALASHTYPGGLAVAYAPNALGQPTRAGSYATSVSYWPNGAMKQFTYGNGIVHTMTPNERQLPERSTDSGGVLDDSYDYDQNGNVMAISDGLSGNRGDRTMTYDGLDRLKTTTSPMFAGGATYAYDVLDSLTRVKAPGRDHYYCYDTRWLLTNVKTGSCAGTSVIGLDYDEQGNLKNKNGVLYTFDLGNRLRQVTGKETYRYDGHGRRVSATSSQGAVYSLYGQDGALRYQRDERKAEAYDYISLNGSLLARVTGPAVIVGVPIVTAPASSNTGTYTVSWTTVALATRYEAQEALNGGAWQAAYTGTATSLARSGKPSGSYGYRVRACRDTTCGNWSATATVAVNVPPASAPTLTAPATAANGTYSVTWTTVGGAESYTLEQSANGGAWSQAYSGAGISQSYSAKPAGSYGYRVKACNPVGCSVVSATATVQSIWPPGAPTISAPAQSNNGSYTVSWTAVAGASSYRLEERVGSGAWAEVQNSTAVSKALTGKADGSYGYRVRACNVAGCGGYSATVTVTVLTPPTALATVNTPASNTTGAYTVSWTAVAKATTYTLQRSANGGAWANAYTGASASFPVSGQGEGSYGYRVQGCNSAGCGGWSAIRTTVVDLPPPATPSLTVPAQVAGSSYTVTWTSVSGALSYVLQESLNSGAWTQRHDGSAVSWAASGKAEGQYSYRVQACNDGGCSGWSAAKVAQVVPPPARPASATITETNVEGKARVSWSAVSGADRYEMKRMIYPGETIEEVAGTTVMLFDYAYEPISVRACRSFACSEWRNASP